MKIIDKKDYRFLFSIFICSVLLIPFLNRLQLGADTTDEAWYAAMSYNLIKGNHLFADMWDHACTSSVIGAFFLALYRLLSGGVEGCILYLRYCFFVCNCITMLVVYSAMKKYIKKQYAILIAFFYLFYGISGIYTFSYNHLANMFFVLTVGLLLIGDFEQRIRYYVFSGICCALLAFVYPPMIVICVTMVLLIFFKHKKIGNKWVYFVIGGAATAIIISVFVLSQAGISKFVLGIKEMLSDPIHSTNDVQWIDKIREDIEYFFYPFCKKGIYIKLFTVWLVVLINLQNKYPVLKFSILLYPIIVFLEMLPLGSMQGYSFGNYMFFMAFMAMFLIYFIDKKKKLYLGLLYYSAIPSLILYYVTSIYAHGDTAQSAQCLFFLAIVTLVEIVEIAEETIERIFEDNKAVIKFLQLILIVVLFAAIVNEERVHYSYVYRDESVSNLKNRINVGPYKGIKTTAEKKKYLEEMYFVMKELEEKDKTVCTLYHAGFAYLYLDMIPKTPLTWGLWVGIYDQQRTFLKYFSLDEENIPEYIFLVDVEDEINYDYQHERYYDYADKLNMFITENYKLQNDIQIGNTGCVKKYQLINNKNTVANLQMENIFPIYEDGFYGIESNEYTSWSWGNQKAVLNLQNDNNDAIKVRITMNVYAGDTSESRLTIKHMDDTYEYWINNVEKVIELNTILQPGTNRLEFETEAEQFVVKGDSRELFFCIRDLNVELEE